MKLAGQNIAWGKILYRSTDPVKKRRHRDVTRGSHRN